MKFQLLELSMLPGYEVKNVVSYWVLILFLVHNKCVGTAEYILQTCNKLMSYCVGRCRID